MSEESSSSNSSDNGPASFARTRPLVATGHRGSSSAANPLQSPSPPISPIAAEVAPLLYANAPLSPPVASGSSARQSSTSRSRPTVSSPLNPLLGGADRLPSSSGGEASSSSSKTSHEDRPPSGTEEFYYAPTALSRYSAASGRLSGVDSGLASDLIFHESPRDVPSYDTSFVRPFSNSGRPSSASLFSLATGEDAKANMLKTATTSALLWDDEKNAEPDDWIHNPKAGEPDIEKIRGWSNRGALNLLGIFFVLGGIIALFITWPIITFVVNAPHYQYNSATVGFPNSGNNSSSSVSGTLVASGTSTGTRSGTTATPIAGGLTLGNATELLKSA